MPHPAFLLSGDVVTVDWATQMMISQWASYQIRKITVCACAGNAGNDFPATDFKGNRYLAIPACITARASRTYCDAFRDSLTHGGGGGGGGGDVPCIPAHALPASLHIWQEAHWLGNCDAHVKGDNLLVRYWFYDFIHVNILDWSSMKNACISQQIPKYITSCDKTLTLSPQYSCPTLLCAQIIKIMCTLFQDVPIQRWSILYYMNCISSIVCFKCEDRRTK